MRKLLTAAATAALTVLATSAQAHLVSIGWLDNGDGTVSIFGEHWHGDQFSPSTANGGLTVSPNADMSGGTLFQWTSVLNNSDRDDMVASGALTGFDSSWAFHNGTDYTNTEYRDWLVSDPIVIGNGTWYAFTGTACCIDTMETPAQFTISGVTSVDPGTGPGTDPGAVVPLPAAGWMLLGGLGALAGLRRRRKDA